MISASDIRERKFEKAAFGYKQEEIDDFLAELISEFEELDAEREDLHSKIQILADKVREYRQDEDALKDALLGAQKQGHKVVAEAQEKADEIIAQAEEKAKILLDEATVQHEAAMEKNRAEIAKEKENLIEAQKQVSEFKKAEGVDLSTDKMALQRLKEAAEKAKKELSSATTTNINLPFITATADGPKHFDMNLTRAKFEELVHDLVERTAIPVQNAMKDAGLNYSDISKVLLVGGSTRVPCVQEKVKQLTGKEPNKSLNPDECVAIGASIQGGKLAGDAGAGDILLLDVTPLSLSIETMGGIATKLIERNTTIPTKKSQVFSTAADNQTAVDINVLQGERQFAKDNKSLGQFRLDGIPPARRGVPQIEVTFDIDANGIVNVSAKDLGTGKEQHITITSGTNMSDDDIEKAVKEAAEFEAQDKKRKEGIEARNEADSMVFQTQKALDEVGDKISGSDRDAVEADLNALKAVIDRTTPESMTDADVDEIKAAKDKLMNSAQTLFAKLYEQGQGAAGAAGPDMGAGAGPDMGNNSGAADDVVDGDYREV